MALALAGALASGCGGGGGDSPGPGGAAPAQPSGVSASPANAQAGVSWTAVSGATSYNVYSSPTSPVTMASSKTSVSATNATLSGLSNGSPVFLAVTAVNANGESALSSEVCAVPTSASTAGVSLYDALCGNTLDGSKWPVPGLLTRRVASGAMVLSVHAANMEPIGTRGLVYSTSATVNAGGQRVTTLRANVTVPAASASRTGSAQLRATLRVAYQPPATRLSAPAGNLDHLTIQVGLQDSGGGLRAFRSVSHCDNATCGSFSSTGIAFVDPAGFSGEAPAAYDTAYTITVSLNETTGIFTWTIAGGAFGAGISGTADPGVYLAGNANWTAVGANPLAGAGFLNAMVRARVTDDSSAGGSSGRLTARFENVHVGFDNAAAALWDDFSGGANSGPIELRANKWTPGEHSVDATGGSLVKHSRITSQSLSGLSYFQGLVFSDPDSVNTLQADVTVTACGNSLGSTNRATLAGHFYNDGTPGTTAPNDNRPYSAVGDIQADLFLDCVAGVARFQVLRWETTSPLTSTILSNFANSTVPMGPAAVVGNTHTLRMRWDPVTRLLTFQVDGATPVVVDPTTVNAHMNIAAPYVKPANAPSKTVGLFLLVPSSPSAVGATAGMDFKLNNVFTAP